MTLSMAVLLVSAALASVTPAVSGLLYEYPRRRSGGPPGVDLPFVPEEYRSPPASTVAVDWMSDAEEFTNDQQRLADLSTAALAALNEYGADFGFPAANKVT
jgi:hypothetical protein